SSITAALTRRAMLAARSSSVLRTLLDVFRRASRTAPLLAIAVLTTGLALGSYGWWAQPWFWVAIGVWVVQAALSRRVVQATTLALAAALPSGDVPVPQNADAIRRSRTWAIAAAVMRGNDLTFLYLMFDKPSIGQSIVFAALSALVCLAL